MCRMAPRAHRCSTGAAAWLLAHGARHGALTAHAHGLRRRHARCGSGTGRADGWAVSPRGAGMAEDLRTSGHGLPLLLLLLRMLELLGVEGVRRHAGKRLLLLG